MSRFTLNPIELGETWYLPLPKLNASQMAFLADRLESKGFTINQSRLLVARKGGSALRIDPSGLCWSRADCSDAIAPAIPDILGMRHEEVGLDEIRSRYLSVDRQGGSVSVRLSTRMESSSLWKALRSRGECGLTPDERAVILMILRSSSHGGIFITDFPCEDSRVRVIGGRQYYESRLEVPEVVSTMRVAGEKRERNSYLPEGEALRFKALRLPSQSEQQACFNGLGEWCYLRPGLPRKL